MSVLTVLFTLVSIVGAGFGFVVVFVGFWCGVVYLLSVLSGWPQIAAAYPTAGPAEGRVYSFQSARLGIVSLKHVLDVQVGTEGIGFSVMPLFRLGHPPFFVPWEDITASPYKMLFLSGALLTLRKTPSIRFALYGASGAAVLDHQRQSPAVAFHQPPSEATT